MTLLLRVRRAFLALCAVLALLLGLRLWGLIFPAGLFLVGPGAALLAYASPLSVRWVRVGRRLGLGGRLAGLMAALESAQPVFAKLLLGDLALRPWRLFFPEALALGPALVLAGLLLLPGEGPGVPGPLGEEAAALAPAEAARPGLPEGTEAREPRPRPAREVPQLPPDFTFAPPPYAELLAGLLGLEVPAEEVGRYLAQEEGLLRRLAELLGEAAQGLSAELRTEFAELVGELRRPDLREVLQAALEREELARAQAAVAAALAGLEAMREELTAEGSVGPGAEERSPEGPAGAQAFVPNGEILMDTEAPEWGRARLEGAEPDGLDLGPGWERGEPVRAGSPRPAPAPEEILPVPARVGEGPARQGFALGLPGETPGAPPEAAPLPTPPEVELVLRARELPAGLRDLVRRYFQLLAEGGGP